MIYTTQLYTKKEKEREFFFEEKKIVKDPLKGKGQGILTLNLEILKLDTYVSVI